MGPNNRAERFATLAESYLQRARTVKRDFYILDQEPAGSEMSSIRRRWTLLALRADLRAAADALLGTGA